MAFSARGQSTGTARKARGHWALEAYAPAAETVGVRGSGGGLETEIQRSPEERTPPPPLALSVTSAALCGGSQLLPQVLLGRDLGARQVLSLIHI